MSDILFVRCPECDGAGEWDEGPINCGGPAPVDPEYRQVKCPECDGTGRVEVEAFPVEPTDDYFTEMPAEFLARAKGATT